MENRSFGRDRIMPTEKELEQDNLLWTEMQRLAEMPPSKKRDERLKSLQHQYYVENDDIRIYWSTR